VNGLGASLLSCGKPRRDGPFLDVRRRILSGRDAPPEGQRYYREAHSQSAFAGRSKFRDI
jgi:hypothetical protein